MDIAPQWTERITNRDVIGEDHLGIETAAATYQGDLLPGIITVTDHARYYSLYCWILWRFINDERHQRRIKNLRGPYFKRLELAHSMACYAHHLDAKDLPGVIGSQHSGVIWRQSDPINLDENVQVYFQNLLGGFGQYYFTAMRLMGLIGEQPNRSDVYQLHTRGIQLAEAFDASIKGTRYYSALSHGDVQSITYADAGDYGEHACVCKDALSKGQDRDLLREALFRLDDGQDIKSHHRARQLSLALLLDMVRQSGNQPFHERLRYVLYLGQFQLGDAYEPRPTLAKTYARWRYVQARQLYTSALQIFWALFLDFLQGEDGDTGSGVSFEDFITWLEEGEDAILWNKPLLQIMQEAMMEMGLATEWRQSCGDLAVRFNFEHDALTRFNAQGDAKNFVLDFAVDMLIDVFMRFYELDVTQDQIWRELAVSAQESHRLSMHDFFKAIEARLENNATLGDVVKWLYQDYVLTQHEYMAIRKLRYNGYDTFKFQYSDGRFYRMSKTYNQPLRHPALRLNNALTMLVDVGLVIEDRGIFRLSADGEAYLNRVEAQNSEH